MMNGHLQIKEGTEKRGSGDSPQQCRENGGGTAVAIFQLSSPSDPIGSCTNVANLPGAAANLDLQLADYLNCRSSMELAAGAGSSP